MFESTEMEVFLVSLFLLTLSWAARGLRVVPIGYRGVVFWLGRRTGDVRQEGLTWLPPFVAGLKCVAVRERQVTIQRRSYFTADRARLTFQTVVRVAVEDAAALLEQGPGTYNPFLRDYESDRRTGDEEENVALNGLVQNAVREGVSMLSSHEVLFGGQGTERLRQSISAQLDKTAHRWGLAVREVWVVDVHGDKEGLDNAFQVEMVETMRGRGSLAKKHAEVAEGALFARVAAQLVQQMAQLGEAVTLQEAIAFLQSSYQNDKDLEVALARSKNVQALAHEWVVVNQSPPRPPAPVLGAERQRLAPSTRAWIVGRNGQIVIDGEGVSRQHARLELDGDQVLVTDLGSMNGTFIGDRRLSPNVPTPLAQGANVRFGERVVLSDRDLLGAARAERVRGV